MADSLDVRHLAMPPEGELAVTACFEKTVNVWNLATGQCTSEFETILDFGGHRLAVSVARGVCIAGAYNAHGVACYELNGGRLLWQRRDMKKIQQITISSDGQSAFCCFDDRPCQVLSVADGHTVGSLRGVHRLWTDANGLDRLEKATELRVVDGAGKRLFPIEGETSAVLAASFGRDFVAVSESGGTTRMLSRTSGEVVRRYSPPSSHHLLDVAAFANERVIHGVQWCYQKGGAKVLLRIPLDGGDVITVRDLGLAWEHAFCRRGTQILTSDGELVDCRTGDTLMRLTFQPPSHRLDGSPSAPQ